jgi:hypothetical protein
MESVEARRLVTALTRWERWWTLAGRVSKRWDMETGRFIAGSEVMGTDIRSMCDGVLKVTGKLWKFKSR